MTIGARTCIGVGIALILSGLGYAALWLIGGGEWQGPTTLRKPILFGLSTSVTLLSVGWVITGLRRRRVDDVLYGSLAVALLVEVALIDLQQARGVASHFNRATPFDADVTFAMTALIAFASVVLAEITVRSWRSMAFAPDDAAAARLGMALLVIGCALGGVITAIGDANAAAGRPPQTFGAAGVLKFPHGLPLHAIQIFYVQAILLRRLRVPLAHRTWSIRAAGMGLLAVTVYGAVQTGLGAPRFPPAGPVAWMLVGAAGAAFAAAAAVVVRRRLRARAGI